MYHEQTASVVAARHRRHRIVAGLCVACAIVAAIILGAVRANAREQGAVAVRDSILRAAQQCCAAEGSYPGSLDYLEDHYGLTINHDDYVISYESFASNVTPSVVVVPR